MTCAWPLDAATYSANVPSKVSRLSLEKREKVYFLFGTNVGAIHVGRKRALTSDEEGPEGLDLSVVGRNVHGRLPVGPGLVHVGPVVEKTDDARGMTALGGDADARAAVFVLVHIVYIGTLRHQRSDEMLGRAIGAGSVESY